MWTNLMFFYYADNLKVSTIVSINFFFLKIVQILGENWLEVRICVRFTTTFYVEHVAVLTAYNDLVLCKDSISNDCLGTFRNFSNIRTWRTLQAIYICACHQFCSCSTWYLDNQGYPYI